jgi:hypothetical protein
MPKTPEAGARTSAGNFTMLHEAFMKLFMKLSEPRQHFKNFPGQQRATS